LSLHWPVENATTGNVADTLRQSGFTGITRRPFLDPVTEVLKKVALLWEPRCNIASRQMVGWTVSFHLQSGINHRPPSWLLTRGPRGPLSSLPVVIQFCLLSSAVPETSRMSGRLFRQPRLRLRHGEPPENACGHEPARFVPRFVPLGPFTG
jgi:hypothetical protein